MQVTTIETLKRTIQVYNCLIVSECLEYFVKPFAHHKT